MMNGQNSPSTRPYLVRALYEWCTDNGFTPYVAVRVDDSVRVPREYVKNGEIVLNISFDATSSLKLGNEFIEFKARFAGVARDIMVPLNRVIAIYARESGQGMAFPLEETAMPQAAAEVESGVQEGVSSQPENKPVQLASVDTERHGDDPEPPRPAGGAKPALKRVK
jgi:stringent starvation protein B